LGGSSDRIPHRALIVRTTTQALYPAKVLGGGRTIGGDEPGQPFGWISPVASSPVRTVASGAYLRLTPGSPRRRDSAVPCRE
jgi:hypothetical protein